MMLRRMRRDAAIAGRRRHGSEAPGCGRLCNFALICPVRMPDPIAVFVQSVLLHTPITPPRGRVGGPVRDDHRDLRRQGPHGTPAQTFFDPDPNCSARCAHATWSRGSGSSPRHRPNERTCTTGAASSPRFEGFAERRIALAANDGAVARPALPLVLSHGSHRKLPCGLLWQGPLGGS